MIWPVGKKQPAQTGGISMTYRFRDKVVLVAGGTGALGQAVTLAFLAESARVLVTYRHPDELQALRSAADGSAGSLSGFQVDVTDAAAVEALVRKIATEYPRIDVMVNAVGAFDGGTPLWSTAPEVLDRMLSLNLHSVFATCRAIAPVMLKQKSGSIVTIGSRAALVPAAGLAAYSASKAAAITMINSLAEDLKGSGVRVNSVIPSIFDTPQNRKAMPGADFSKWPKPEDIAKAILFLCSDDAKLIHGASMPVYGDT